MQKIKNDIYENNTSYNELEESLIEGVNELILQLKKEEDIKKYQIKRFKKLFNDEKSFSNLVEKIINKDEKYNKEKYKTYSEEPSNLIYCLFDVSMNEGDALDEEVDDFSSSFSSSICKYMNYIFTITYGQGSVMGIYDINKNLLFRI